MNETKVLSVSKSVLILLLGYVNTLKYKLRQLKHNFNGFATDGAICTIDPVQNGCYAIVSPVFTGLIVELVAFNDA